MSLFMGAMMNKFIVKPNKLIKNIQEKNMINFLEEKEFAELAILNASGGFETMRIDEADYPWYWIRYLDIAEDKEYMLCASVREETGGVPLTFAYPSDALDYLQQNIFDKQKEKTTYMLSIHGDDPDDERFAQRH